MRLRTLLAAVALAACGSSPPAGPPRIDDGVRLTYTIAAGAPADAAQVINRRLARARIKGWASAQGAAIVVDLAAADPERLDAARDLIARTGRFALHLVDDRDPAMARLAEAVRADPASAAAGVSVQRSRWRPPTGADREEVFLAAGDREEVVDVATAQRLGCYPRDLGDHDERVPCRITGRVAIQQQVSAAIVLDATVALPPDRQLAYELAAVPDARPSWRTYEVVGAAALASDAIADARRVRDPVTDRPVVQLQLTDPGTRAFADLTRAHIGSKVALILDDRVVSAPILMGPITSGRLTLTTGAGDAPAEVAALATVLASGPLPGPVVLETALELKGGQVVVPPPP